MTILLTGGTGRLGRHVAETLRSRSLDHRILSRRPGDGHVVADLDTGEGLAAALEGVDTVAAPRHVALEGHRADPAAAGCDGRQRQRGRPPTCIFISIVGVDRIPFGYYRDKFASEQAIEASGVPFTIIRVTQFHGFVTEALDAQRRSAGHPGSADLGADDPHARGRGAARGPRRGGPSGRVADLGGPEQLTFREYAELWQKKRGIRRPIWALHLPGRIVGAFKAGHHMSGLPGAGRVTYREYLEAGE